MMWRMITLLKKTALHHLPMLQQIDNEFMKAGKSIGKVRRMI